MAETVMKRTRVARLMGLLVIVLVTGTVVQTLLKLNRNPLSGVPVGTVLTTQNFPSGGGEGHQMQPDTRAGRVYLSYWVVPNPKDDPYTGYLQIAMLDARTGRTVRILQSSAHFLDDSSLEDMWLSPTTGRAFIEDTGPNSPLRVRVLDGRTGNLLATTSLGQSYSGGTNYVNDQCSCFAEVDGAVFLEQAVSNNSAPAVLRIFDAGTGRLVGTRRLRLNVDLTDTVVADAPRDRVIVVQGAQNSAYLTHGQSLSPIIEIIDAHTGTLVHTLQPYPAPSPYVYLAEDPVTGTVLTYDGFSRRVQSLDVQTGRLTPLATIPSTNPNSLDTVLLDHGADHAFAVQEGGYDGCCDSRKGALTMFDMRTGTILRSWQLGTHPSYATIAPQAHRLFVMVGTDMLCIDTRTGSVVRTVPLGSDIQDMQVDQSGRYVYVLGSDTLVTLDATTGRPVRVVHLSTTFGGDLSENLMTLVDSTHLVFVTAGDTLNVVKEMS
jgi:hypothetical protein